MNYRTLLWAGATAIALAACGDTEVSSQDGGRDAASRSGATAEATAQILPDERRYADQNADGVVTLDEARADPALAASFDRYDANRDRTLDRAEFARLEAGEEPHATLRPRREFPRPLD
jgi:hypothetical protein